MQLKDICSLDLVMDYMGQFRGRLISSQGIHQQIGPRKVHPQHCPYLGPHINILVTVTALGFHMPTKEQLFISLMFSLLCSANEHLQYKGLGFWPKAYESVPSEY